MALEPVIRVGHLRIVDHLILGVTKDRLDKSEERFQHSFLETVSMGSWKQLAEALSQDALDGAFVTAPLAMDLFRKGTGIKLILFTRNSGSILVKNRRAGIDSLEDFRGKVVLVPHELSIQNMLFHRLLSSVGLLSGDPRKGACDVFIEVAAPAVMPDAIKYDDEGRIGGFIVEEPMGALALAGGYGEAFCPTRELWPDHPCCVFVVRDEIIEKYPDALHEITESLVRSGSLMEEEPENASVAAASFLAQDPLVIGPLFSSPGSRVALGRLFPKKEELAVIQEYMSVDMNLMKARIDVGAFVDTRFAETAGAR